MSFIKLVVDRFKSHCTRHETLLDRLSYQNVRYQQFQALGLLTNIVQQTYQHKWSRTPISLQFLDRVVRITGSFSMLPINYRFGRRYSGGKRVIYTSSRCRFLGRIDGDGLNWRRAFIRASVLRWGVFEMATALPLLIPSFQVLAYKWIGWDV